MLYNIIKEMVGLKTSKKSFILLTDGLSQIWDVEKEAQRITTMMTENYVCGWVYKIRKNCIRK
jgi:hypothetical protein